MRSSIFACKTSKMSADMNRWDSSKSCIMNFLPSFKVSSKCSKNCFMAGSLKSEMSRKGLSVEEKKERMLSLLYEKREFFQLKDLEKIAPKEKGIIVNSVKDVLQSLVDDGLVDTDKIGTSVYFWAFPSKAAHLKKLKISELEAKVNERNKQLKLTTETLNELKSDDNDDSQRNKYLDEIMELEIQKKNLDKELEKFADCDPSVLKRMKEQTQKLKEAANRWTDNVFSVKSWCKEKFNVEDAVIDKQFGIPDEFDYVD